jgi:hypothetical protein
MFQHSSLYVSGQISQNISALMLALIKETSVDSDLDLIQGGIDVAYLCIGCPHDHGTLKHSKLPKAERMPS